jgi:hypothetical protein
MGDAESVIAAIISATLLVVIPLLAAWMYRQRSIVFRNPAVATIAVRDLRVMVAGIELSCSAGLCETGLHFHWPPFAQTQWAALALCAAIVGALLTMGAIIVVTWSIRGYNR